MTGISFNMQWPPTSVAWQCLSKRTIGFFLTDQTARPHMYAGSGFKNKLNGFNIFFLLVSRHKICLGCILSFLRRQQLLGIEKWKFNSATREQGDLIGRIFAQLLVIVYIEQFNKNYKSVAKFWATFFPKYRLCSNFKEILVGLHFGRFFSQYHLVTLLASKTVFSDEKNQKFSDNIRRSVSFYWRRATRNKTS
jgi:hypothetical protein